MVLNIEQQFHPSPVAQGGYYWSPRIGRNFRPKLGEALGKILVHKKEKKQDERYELGILLQKAIFKRKLLMNLIIVKNILHDDYQHNQL